MEAASGSENYAPNDEQAENEPRTPRTIRPLDPVRLRGRDVVTPELRPGILDSRPPDEATDQEYSS